MKKTLEEISSLVNLSSYLKVRKTKRSESMQEIILKIFKEDDDEEEEPATILQI
jgi:hypothetical protein